jgi:hypothetical protein
MGKKKSAAASTDFRHELETSHLLPTGMGDLETNYIAISSRNTLSVDAF